MKYEKIDWSKWPESPEQDAYEAWLAVRKAKRCATTQRAINLAAKHVNHLVAMGYTVTEVLDLAIEKSWAGLEWVAEYESKKGYKKPVFSGNVTTLRAETRSTRDISLDEELNDRSWAK